MLGMLFTICEVWWLYAVGLFLFMMIMPLAEASEQTIIHKVVPYEKQGRLFGLAHGVESGSAPVSSFVIGAIAQFALIPMASAEGQAMFGWLLGAWRMASPWSSSLPVSSC